MTATTTGRNTKQLIGDTRAEPVAAGAKLLPGTLVVRNATGYAQMGTTATGLVARGVAEALSDNSNGADGDVQGRVSRGVYQFANSAAADAITQAEVGDNCYIVDNQTVAKTDGTGTRSVAGKIEAVDDGGVWVRFD